VHPFLLLPAVEDDVSCTAAAAVAGGHQYRYRYHHHHCHHHRHHHHHHHQVVEFNASAGGLSEADLETLAQVVTTLEQVAAVIKSILCFGLFRNPTISFCT
jgi:hypothetical protein